MRKPIKRVASETSTMFEKPEEPKQPSRSPSASRSTVEETSGPAKDAPGEPSKLWAHMDELLDATMDITRSLQKKTAKALEKHTKSIGSEVLASVASLTGNLGSIAGKWKKQSAPSPPMKSAKKREADKDKAADLGPVLVDLHLAEVRAATDAFIRTIADVAVLIDDAETERAVCCAAACDLLTTLFGDELVEEAARHEPTQRATIERMAKRAHMGSASLVDAMKLVGDEWERDVNAGPGRLVVRSADFEIAVDVAFATFRVRERQMGQHIDLVTHAPLPLQDFASHFVSTHYRIDP